MTDRFAVQTINASEFKVKCLKLMEEVSETCREMVITKRGCPIERLVAYREEKPRWIGADRGELAILGDIVSPIDVEREAVSKSRPSDQPMILRRAQR